MSKVLLLVLGLIAATLAAQTPADPELQAILDLAQPAPPPAPGVRRSETLRASDTAARQLRTLGLAYLARHPAGPGRARVILALDGRRPMFIETFKSGFDENPSGTLIVRDLAAYEAWSAELARLLRALRADPTAEPAQRTQALRAVIAKEMWTAKTATELSVVHAMIEELAASDEPAASAFLSSTGMFYVYATLGIPALEQYLTTLAAHPRESFATPAREALAALTRQQTEAGQIKFTAVDGREVDLAKLRGKVVLVDFWATWCGPCIAELPNIKQVYAAYHDRGFEVIGVSLDRPADRQKLLDFVQRESMPWPQYYDGLYWKNELAVKYAIKAIPAMFLLDQEGRLVSTNARGEKLEAEVKRLLKL